MIQITQKKNCCGCQACEQACPAGCISMRMDAEGFAYPVVDEKRCVHCDLCEHVCPMLNPSAEREPIALLAARSQQETVRASSSSGGLFTELARWVLRQGGVVFGARFAEDWTVLHDWTDEEEGLMAFQGSKYVQSRIGNTFKQVRALLKEDRWVLFSGTSCQIAALRRFLRKDYGCLLTVDVVCHGVPSAKIWQSYLKRLAGDTTHSIRHVRFRDKQQSWKNYQFVCLWKGGEVRESFRENAYMKAFLSDSLLRPSCYHCPCKSFATPSDLTLADYWGIQVLQPALDDDRGIGLAFVHTERMREILQELPLVMEKVTAPLCELQRYNPSIARSVNAPLPVKRFLFYRLLACGVPFSFLVNVLLRKRGIIGFVKQKLGMK